MSGAETHAQLANFIVIMQMRIRGVASFAQDEVSVAPAPVGPFKTSCKGYFAVVKSNYAHGSALFIGISSRVCPSFFTLT